MAQIAESFRIILIFRRAPAAWSTTGKQKRRRSHPPPAAEMELGARTWLWVIMLLNEEPDRTGRLIS